MDNHSEQIVKTCDVIGKDVVSSENDSLGKIEEIVLDKVTGHARYAVLSCGGFLGVGDKLYALPWKSLNYDETEDAFKLSLTKEKFKSAPNFSKNQWPDFADSTFDRSITDFYA